MPQEFVEKLTQYFDCLEALRQSGATNMFGAGPFLARDFNLDDITANEILTLWMRTYSARKSGTPIDRLDFSAVGGYEAMIDRLGTEVRP